MRPRPTPILIAAVIAAALAVPCRAQVEIDRRIPAPPRGELRVSSAFGSILVKAWEKNEVAVRGRMAAGAEGFDLDGDKEGTSVDVSVPEAWLHAPGEDDAFRSTLEISAPAGSRVSVETVNANVVVEGFASHVDAVTVNGGVRVTGPATEIEVETMTGTVDVAVQAAPMRVQTISGTVKAAGVTGETEIETVSGGVEVSGANVSSLQVKSTTGAISFHGSLARQGGIEIETFSSPVRLVLPKATRAAFRIQTFGGKIQSDFCAGTPVMRERFEPFRQLRCSTGPEDFEIDVRTHDADITIAAE
jgi:hypothetical protein